MSVSHWLPLYGSGKTALMLYMSFSYLTLMVGLTFSRLRITISVSTLFCTSCEAKNSRPETGRIDAKPFSCIGVHSNNHVSPLNTRCCCSIEIKCRSLPAAMPFIMPTSACATAAERLCCPYSAHIRSYTILCLGLLPDLPGNEIGRPLRQVQPILQIGRASCREGV